MTENSLLTAPIPKLYLRYVLPAMAAMVLDGIQGIVDGIFIGNFVGPEAMASVNIANPYFQIIIGSSMVICTGTMSAAGRALGAGKIQEAKDVYRSALVALGCISLLLLLAGRLFYSPIAQFLGADALLLNNAGQYIRTLALFVPIISFKILFGFTGRLIERPQLYLAGTVSTIFSNIILDFLAVKVLGLGVTGAAAATGLAYLAGLCVTCRPLLFRNTVLNVHDGSFRPRLILKAAFNGSSEGVTYAANALTVFLLNRAFMGFAGAGGVAAFTVISYVGNFVTLLMFGMSDGISPILSNNYGAGNLGRIRRTLAAALAANLAMGIFLFALFFLFGERLIRLFVNGPGDAPVIAMAVQGAKIYGLCFLANGFNILQSGFHTALGDALSSIAIAASRGIVFIIIGLALFSSLWGINGVWFTLPFAEFMTVFCCLGILTFKRKRRTGI